MTLVKTFKTLTEAEFYERFNPIKNHFYTNPEDCSFNGCMFETYGKELLYILRTIQKVSNKKQIWTIIDSEGKLYITSGYHHVDRFGYMLTKERVPEGIEYCVEPDKEEGDNESGPFDQLGYEQTKEE
jgi:hypothetical protein